jgi:4-amino-4-deoxy-L-arabinose transferase-like glycosyltransferase
MKEFFKNLGLILMIGGVVVLVYTVGKKILNNVALATSALLILGGMVAHVFLNRYIDPD